MSSVRSRSTRTSSPRKARWLSTLRRPGTWRPPLDVDAVSRAFVKFALTAAVALQVAPLVAAELSPASTSSEIALPGIIYNQTGLLTAAPSSTSAEIMPTPGVLVCTEFTSDLCLHSLKPRDHGMVLQCKTPVDCSWVDPATIKARQLESNIRKWVAAVLLGFLAIILAIGGLLVSENDRPTESEYDVEDYPPPVKRAAYPEERL
jgi:hypothetical protein